MKRYGPRERIDSVSIRDEKYKVLIVFMGIVVAIIFAVFVLLGIADDNIEGGAIVGALFVLGYSILLALECDYKIYSDHICIKHGLFWKNINYENVELCVYRPDTSITLVQRSEKNYSIDLSHIKQEYLNYFLDAFRGSNIRIKTIGAQEKIDKILNLNYSFKVYPKRRILGYVFTIIMMLFFYFVLLGALVGDDRAFMWIWLAFTLAFTVFFIHTIAKLSATFAIDGSKIVLKRLFKKPMILDIKDISWFTTRIGEPHNKYINNYVEEMLIYVDGKELNWHIKPNRDFNNYDLLMCYLQDNGVAYSLDEKELITYEEVENESQKPIQEILNLDEHAFTVNDEGIIENGIFEGKKFSEEYQFKNERKIKILRVIDIVTTLLKILVYISLYVSIKLFADDIIGFFEMIFIPAGLILFGIGLAQFVDYIVYIDVIKNGKQYEATILNADVSAKNSFINYAYCDGEIVKMVVADHVDDKITQEEIKKRYGQPITIIVNENGIPLGIEENYSHIVLNKFIKKILLYLIVTVGLVVAAIFCHKNFVERQRYDFSKVEEGALTPNDNYQNILIAYNDYGTFETMKSIDVKSDIYKWGANLTSIYAYMEDYADPKVLTGHVVDSYIFDDTVEMLEVSWNITDRESAKGVIDKTITYGYQAKYRYLLEDEYVQQLIEAIQEDYGDEFSYEDALEIDEEYFEAHNIPTKYFYTVKGAACAYCRFSDDALIGYDYLRLVRMSYLAYQCGYITREECQQLLYNMETDLQNRYSSFSEIHECYYYGEMVRLGRSFDKAAEIVGDVETAIQTMSNSKYYNNIDKYYKNKIDMK